MPTSFIKNPCNWYFLIWVIQIIHDPLGLYGDGTSVVVLFSLYLWSFYYFLVTIKKYNKSRFIKAWSQLYILFMIYGLYEMMVSSSHNRLYIIGNCTSMLPLYPFYVYAMKGYLTKSVFRLWSLVMIPVALVNFYYGQEMAFQLVLGQDVAGVTNNMGYSIAMIIPMLYFWKDKPIVQFAGYAIISVLTILALKRGAILIAALALVLILLHLRKASNRSNKFVSIILGLFFLLGIGYFIQKQTASNDYLMERYTQTINGDTSERGNIYSDAYNYYVNEMSLANMIFGMGANGCVKAIKTEAHNDWLETLISLGLVGIFFFTRFWLSAYKFYKKESNTEVKFLFGLVALLLFVRTFFSMSIADIYIYSTSILGFCLANTHNSDKDII